MYVYFFTFRSVTHAQQAASTLNTAGIPVNILRTPKAIAVHGCGYSVQVRTGFYRQAADELTRHGVQFQRIFCRLPDGSFEEVSA